MGQVNALNCIQQLEFSDYVTSGYVNPQTLWAKISTAGGIPGASLPYTDGTGALQADSLYFKPIALAGAAQTINLQSLTGLDGEALVLARCREFVLFNPDGTAGHDVKVYQGATNPWAIAPPSTAPWWARASNGSFRLSDPNSTGAGNGNVVTATSCEVTLDPGTNTVTVYLLVLGGSAA
jgi:hypothetical protein